MSIFSKEKVTTNDMINGSKGRVWINGIKRANVQSFEAKITYSYEEVNIAEDLGTHQMLMGYSGEGTVTLNKVDSMMLELLGSNSVMKNGVLPEVTIVALVEKSSTGDVERVQFNEVTFDELTLTKFDQKAPVQEEVPFKFASITVLDKM